MLTRAGKVIDWIEATCRVPEGRHVGEWMVLLDFKRDLLDDIYNNPRAVDPTAPPAREIEDLIFNDEIGENDIAALELAMDGARAQGRGKQLDEMLKNRSWHRVAKFAAYCCQRRALHLAPHETPPCHVERLNKLEPQERKPAELQRRMLKHGVSRWHPYPMAAIATAKAAKAAQQQTTATPPP
jgi:hypothetical protein